MSDDEQLAVRETERLPDAYEREYMRGEGTVVYRDKTGSPWQLHAIFGAVATMLVVSAIAAPGGWAVAAFSLPLVALLWLLFSVLRVTVSEGSVNVQLGLFGPKIPIAAIESAEPLDYDWKQFGGWGIRMNRKGEWMYNLPGDGGRAVKIVWRDRKHGEVGRLGRDDELAGDLCPQPRFDALRPRGLALPVGKRKVTYVASREADGVAAAIDRARAALPAASTKPALPRGD